MDMIAQHSFALRLFSTSIVGFLRACFADFRERLPSVFWRSLCDIYSSIGRSCYQCTLYLLCLTFRSCQTRVLTNRRVLLIIQPKVLKFPVPLGLPHGLIRLHSSIAQDEMSKPFISTPLLICARIFLQWFWFFGRIHCQAKPLFRVVANVLLMVAHRDDHGGKVCRHDLCSVDDAVFGYSGCP